MQQTGYSPSVGFIRQALSRRSTGALFLGLASLGVGCLTGVPAIVLSILELRDILRGKRGRTGIGLTLLGLLTALTGSILSIVVAAHLGSAILTGPARREQRLRLLNMSIAFQCYCQRNEEQGDGCRFPPPMVYGRAMVSPDPYFSWRVLLLPWMVEQPEKTFLFCYDEPWDSPDNLDQLRSVEMPFAYRPVRRQLPAPYYTGCRMFVGKDLPFSRPNGVRWEDLPSPAETFLVVEAKEPVAWTEPRELVYNPKQPLPELGGEFNDGFAALMADGSVRFVKHSASEQVLRAYITGRPEDHSRSGR